MVSYTAPNPLPCCTMSQTKVHTAIPGPGADGLLRADNPPVPPFENTRDTRFYFPSAGHAEALARLLFLAGDRNMGIGLLTGEIGAGKTLLRTLLHARLAGDEHVRVSIENSLLDFDGLLLEVLSQMRGERVQAREYPDRYSRLAAFKQMLSEQVAATNRHLILLVDEAQQLDDATLEALKALTNIASERQNFLTLILIGQPELRGRLRRLPQVDQRVSLRFHLTALARAETGDYIMARLRAARYEGPAPYTAAALDLLHQASRGIPREINRLCKLALEHVVTHGSGRIDEQAIGVVIDDLRRHGALADPGQDATGTGV
jgi:general secretion pathway protein A